MSSPLLIIILFLLFFLFLVISGSKLKACVYGQPVPRVPAPAYAPCQDCLTEGERGAKRRVAQGAGPGPCRKEQPWPAQCLFHSAADTGRVHTGVNRRLRFPGQDPRTGLSLGTPGAAPLWPCCGPAGRVSVWLVEPWGYLAYRLGQGRGRRGRPPLSRSSGCSVLGWPGLPGAPVPTQRLSILLAG